MKEKLIGYKYTDSGQEFVIKKNEKRKIKKGNYKRGEQIIVHKNSE